MTYHRWRRQSSSIAQLFPREGLSAESTSDRRPNWETIRQSQDAFGSFRINKADRSIRTNKTEGSKTHL